MSVKLLHSRAKIFFPNPYVLRLEYSNDNMLLAEANYRKLIRQAYKLFTGTWGYCQLEHEMIKLPDEATSSMAILMNGINQTHLTPLFVPEYESKLRGYLCFADELDAMQFRLSISENALQVFMWPERWFTIHEMVEDEI